MNAVHAFVRTTLVLSPQSSRNHMAHQHPPDVTDTVRDRFGDLHVDAPNPVNVSPQFMGDRPSPKPTAARIPPLPPPAPANKDAGAINRPPKAPDHALGPYFNFITTDFTKMVWMGSALIFRHVSCPRPRIDFVCDATVEHSWEVLYDDLFDMCAYRVNISIELRPGEGDEVVSWSVDWGDDRTKGVFHIARRDQNWRGGFFSCNGFDAYVPERVASDLTYSNVWNHLLSVHDEKPLHLLIWGGDQNYIDFIFEDVPFLRAWLNMAWNEKWTTDFRDDVKEQVERYHFYTYTENWQRRPEVRRALSSVPSVMMWDDHDIFDGAGSYPPLLRDSPMMMGLFAAAQKMRLLFQHHTTVEKAREHGLFGHQAYNFFARCGPRLAILGADGRTERDIRTVHHPASWDMIFSKLHAELDGVEHLLVVFPVPFSFIRFHLAESVMEYEKNLPPKVRSIKLLKSTNSIFDLPEFYDDLLDEWIHDAHIEERNAALRRFQQLAEEKRVRVTYLSGDVHCCGVSQFKSSEPRGLAPTDDPKLMYQIISSAIVNMPPSRMAIRAYHLFKAHWNPIEHTSERLIEFFNRRPENGRKVFHRKLRPNRNWCYFEQITDPQAIPMTTSRKRRARLLRAKKKKKTAVLPINLGLTSNHDGLGTDNPPVHIHGHHRRCHEVLRSDEPQIGTEDLLLRLWLESARKHRDGRQFIAYNLIVPDLK